MCVTCTVGDLLEAGNNLGVSKGFHSRTEELVRFLRVDMSVSEFIVR